MTPDPSNPSPTPSSTPRDADESQRLLEVGLAGESTTPAVARDLEELKAKFPDLEFLGMRGEGGMGRVFRVRQRTLDRIAALKLLHADLAAKPQFGERFTREARALAKLKHPHIVHVYEFGEREGCHYLLHEFVDGVTLRELMNSKSVTPQEALEIVPQICAALQYAHNEGVVHRDIKPENILLDRQGRIKVTDFGLAKLASSPDDITLTGTGQVMGTLQYMAPEQYKTPNEIDHRTDIFSLGVVFYEMLTGELPVGRFQDPTTGTDLDSRVDAIVMRALERERDLRYQSARDLESDVRTVTHGVGGMQPRPKSRARVKLRPVSRWAHASCALLLLGPVACGALANLFGSELGWGDPNGGVSIKTGLIMGTLSIASALVSAMAIAKTVPGVSHYGGHYRAWAALAVSVILTLVSIYQVTRGRGYLNRVARESSETSRFLGRVPYVPGPLEDDHLVLFEGPAGVHRISIVRSLYETIRPYDDLLSEMKVPLLSSGVYDGSWAEQRFQDLPDHSELKKRIVRFRDAVGLEDPTWWPEIPPMPSIVEVEMDDEGNRARVRITTHRVDLSYTMQVAFRRLRSRWTFEDRRR